MAFRRNLRGALLLVFIGTAAVVPRTGAHEPITTKVTFNKEIARIFQRSCWGCHSEGKFKADIPLTTYEEARPWAKAIKEEVLEKRMPPYQAVKGYGNFQHDYILPQREVELIVSWVEGGAPRGDAKHYPQAENGWALGPPDLILQPRRAVKLSGEGEDEVRCFSLPTGLKEARWLSAVDFQPGNGLVVYRAAIAVGDDTEKGQSCGFDQVAQAGTALSYWQPGQTALQFPAGMARQLPAEARLKLVIHYRNNGEDASDRSQLALYFAKEAVPKPVRNVAIIATPTELPVKAEPQAIKSTYTLTEAAEAVAVRPLLFPFGQSVEVTAQRPNGTVEVLIWARNYRYNWQPSYVFKRPVALPRGTRIAVTAYLENSEDNRNNPHDPPKTIRYADPLCELLLTAATPAKPTRR